MTQQQFQGGNNKLNIRLIFLLLLFFFPTALWFAYDKNREVSQKDTLRAAEIFVSSISAYRTFYSKTIVKKMGGIPNISVVHNYKEKPNSVPLPATFAKEYGAFYSKKTGYKVNLYSDLPFPWREKEQALDEFETKALGHLRQNANQPVWRFEETKKGQVLRYAIADVLTESCVGCHNSYSGTPKTDWKIGDVRGVLSVTVPATQHTAMAWFKQFGVLLGIIFLAAFLLVLTLRNLIRSLQRERTALNESKQARERLEDEAAERTAVTRNLEINLAKSRSVFNSMGDALVVINEKGIILETNQAVERLLGYKPEELVGKNVSLIVCKQHKENHDAYLEAYHKTGKKEILGKVRNEKAMCKDGREIPIELSVNEATTSEGRVYTGIIHDVSERVEAEKELDIAHKAALESAQVKAQFLANMSHEIRTPMNGIIGMAQLMGETKLSEEQSLLMNTINASTKSLLRIVNDVLDFSKIESGTYKIESEWFNLIELIEEVVTLNSEQAFDKKIALSFLTEGDTPIHVYGDRDRIRQVLTNLLHNAIKFTDIGYVLVQLTAVFNEEEQVDVVVSIKDSGIGIPASQMDKLFDSFSQVDGTKTRRHDGSGLGLAISKSLVELMYGEIKVDSQEGHGSTFTVHLPLVCKGKNATPKLRERMSVALLTEDGYLGQTYCAQLLRFGVTRCTIVPDLETVVSHVETNHDAKLAVIDVNFVLQHGEDALMDTVDKLVAVDCYVVLYADPRQTSVLGQKMNNKGMVEFVNTPIVPSYVLSALQFLQIINEDTLHPADVVMSPVELPSVVSNRDCRILVAEDNKINSLVITRMLNKCGYHQVVWAENGALAVDALEKENYDLVFMDCQMPVMDGFEATRLIRELDAQRTQHTKVIALTANALESDREACLAAGMDDYLAKPVDLGALRQMLAQWLGKVED